MSLDVVSVRRSAQVSQSRCKDAVTAQTTDMAGTLRRRSVGA
jgi:hypothetical protein